MNKKIEDEITEFKEEWPTKNFNILKEINAFLNTEGGILFIGIDDDGNEIGIMPTETQTIKDAKRDMEEKLWNLLSINSNKIIPNPSELISTYFNKKNVFCIKVKKGNNRPYGLEKDGRIEYYIRHGNTTLPCSREELIRLAQEVDKYGYDEQISSKQKLTFSYLTEFINKQLEKESTREKLNEILEIDNNNSWKWNDDVYKSLRMKNANNKFTNLGYLVSDQNEIPVIKVFVYEKLLELNSDLEQEPVDKFISESGSIIKRIELVIDKLNTLNQKTEIINPKTNIREEITSYPGYSIREAIYNAIIHANYYLFPGRIIQINVSYDKLEIISPGKLNNNKSIHIGISDARNPNLLWFISKMGKAEGDGKGFKRIKSAYKKYLDENKKTLHDLIDLNHENTFIITLPNQNKDKYPYIGKVSNEVNISTNIKDQIYNFVKQNIQTTQKQIKDELKIDRKTIRKYIEQLDNENKIQRLGKTKSQIIKIKNISKES